MSARSVRSGLALLTVTLALFGCSNPQGLDSIAVSPASQSLTVGQKLQLTATGTFGNAKHPSTKDVTTSVTWSSNLPAVATVDPTGLVTAVGAGTAAITASATAYNGPVSASALITVPSTSTGSSGGGSSGGSGSSGGNILSLTIIPSGIDLGAIGDSGQFLAIATFSTSPTVRDVTNDVTWFTSEPNKFPVSNNVASGAPGAGSQNGGVASAYESSTGSVGATITAEMKDTNGSIATATASVGCSLQLPNPTGNPPTPGHCDQPTQQLLSTLTVYNEGMNSTTWQLTAPSVTLTPDVIHCGPLWTANGGAGGSVCTATYPLFTSVTVKATSLLNNGVRSFGGWSSNCLSTTESIVGNVETDTCTIPLTVSDATVGAIFNKN